MKGGGLRVLGYFGGEGGGYSSFCFCVNSAKNIIMCEYHAFNEKRISICGFISFI